MLTVNAITKTIEGRPVLRGIDFTLEPGIVAGLIGRNGAGKTTLLKTMAGILDPDAGVVELDGKPIHRVQEARRELVFVPDSPEAWFGYTPSEAAGWLAQVYPAFDRTYFEATLRRLDLPSAASVRQLSKGMRMLFSIALGLSTRAPYVLLDEPTNGVDPIAKKQVLSMLVDAASEGRTLVVSSHLLEELERMTDRLLLMKNGRIESFGTEEALDGAVSKLQLAFEGDAPEEWLALPGVRVLEHVGRVYTVLVDPAGEALERLDAYRTLIREPLPAKLDDVYEWKFGGYADDR